jgi:uncharacterized protein
MSNEIRLAALPFELEWLNRTQHWSRDNDGLTIIAGPGTDWFVSPAGGEPKTNAPALVGNVHGDFSLSAHIEVDFKSTYDAGVLALWRNERTWAKLCLEFSPRGEAMVISVVTQRASDDCNSFVIDRHAVWLRVSRIGQAYAFHASTDGSWWHLVRHFAFAETGDLAVGFQAQSPLGEQCTARFADIRFLRTTLLDLRDGS